MSARTLISMEKLPTRLKFLDRVQVEADIREAMAVLERRLYDRASGYTVGGYEWGEPTYGISDHTVVGKLRLERPE